MLYICIFPACCFHQRTYVAQGLVNRVLNETWTHSCFQFKWPLVGQEGLYRGHSPSFLECVYFGLLFQSLIFDMFIVVCVCVYIGVRLVWGFTNSFFPFFFCGVCECVSSGSFVVLNLLVVLPPFLYMYTHICVYMCVCVCMCFQLFSFIWEHVW